MASNAHGYPRHARRLLGKPQAPAHPRATPTALSYRPKISPQRPARPAPAQIADAIPVSSRLIPSALWPTWYDGRGYPNLCAPAAREPSRPAAQISANSKRGDMHPAAHVAQPPAIVYNKGTGTARAPPSLSAILRRSYPCRCRGTADRFRAPIRCRPPPARRPGAFIFAGLCRRNRPPCAHLSADPRR